MTWARPLLIGAMVAVAVVAGAAAPITVNNPSADLEDFSTQNETTIAVSGSNVVIAWNDMTAMPDPGVSWIGYGVSSDRGTTWSDAGVLSPPPNATNVGDPVLAVDGSGTFYLATMVVDELGHNFLGVAKSSAGASSVTFDTPPVLISGTDSTVVQDKPWLAVDTTAGAFGGRVYVCWKERATDNILFVRSTSQGAGAPLTFTTPQALATGTAVHGCSVAVGPGGELYVAWLDGWRTTSQTIQIRKSVDGGATFGAARTVAAPRRSGHMKPCGSISLQVLKSDIRVADFPAMAVDASAGSFQRAVYIAFTGDPDGPGPDESDVFVTRSPANPAAPAAGDPGVTWSAPVSIHKAPAAVLNADTTSHDNWQPAIAVSPTNGMVMASFYDRRRDAASPNVRIDLFKATSKDGGATWSNASVTGAAFGVPRLAPNFNPISVDCYMGEYNGITASGPDFLLAWGDNTRVITTSNAPAGRPDPDVAFTLLPGLCEFTPAVLCGMLPPSKLFNAGLYLEFDKRDRAWIDPFERNCRLKWSCPGCVPGPTGLCASFYNVVFDFKRAGLDPDIVRIRLFDASGRELARAKSIGGRQVFSFRPRRFAKEGAGEHLFFLFTLGPRGKTGTRYVVPAQLHVSDKALAGTMVR